jgi:hypothetical protein
MDISDRPIFPGLPWQNGHEERPMPLHRSVQRPGAVVAIPILAGLHHEYVRQ